MCWVFVAALGLSLVAECEGCSRAAVLGLLIVVASLVGGTGSRSMNIEVPVSFLFIFLSRYMPRNGIARLHGSSIFSFLRNLHNVFHSGCPSLHSGGECFQIQSSIVFSGTVS